MYKIVCVLCAHEGRLSIYYGESGHSLYYRGNFHLQGLKKKNPKNVLYNHQMEMHPDVQMTMKDFKMSLEGTFKRPILRQSLEGVSLSRAIRTRDQGAPIVIMNSKMEFHQPGVIRPSFSPVLES